MQQNIKNTRDNAAKTTLKKYKNFLIKFLFLKEKDSKNPYKNIFKYFYQGKAT